MRLNTNERFDVTIMMDKQTTVRELEPGTNYITQTRVRNAEVNAGDVRIRTTDPFKSLTLLGTVVSSYPSDKCYPVKIRPITFLEGFTK